MVRKFTAIVFLFLAISTTEGGYQMMKLPLLITHYRLHIAERRSADLLSFLNEHYSKIKHNDHDSKQDEELPFRAINANAFTSLFISLTGITNPLHPNEVGGIKMNCSIDQFINQQHLAGVFHPPRIA